MEVRSRFNPEAERTSKKEALETLARRFETVDSVRVASNGLNGDLLGDVRRLVSVRASRGGVVVLYGNYRSGKTSILRTLEQENADIAYYDVSATGEFAAQAALDTVEARTPNARIIITDEIGALDETEQINLMTKLLGEGRGVVMTMMLGHENQDEVQRRLAKLHSADYSLIKMNSRDMQAGLLRRLHNSFLRVQNGDPIMVSPVENIIRQVEFTDEAFQEIGKITAFRPWEVQSFFQGFLSSCSGEKLVFNTMDIREFFEDQERFLKGGAISRITEESVPGTHNGILRVLHKPRYVDSTPEERHANREMETLSRVAHGLSVDTSYGIKVLHRLLDLTGLGYIENNGNDFSIRGEWLKRDWNSYFQYW